MNNLFVSGGSQCYGGGFLWDYVKEAYKIIDITIDNNFQHTYPTLLGQKLNLEVINEGAPGGSITRMIRKTYEYIFEKGVLDTIFILEVPPGWRDEFYSNEYKRYFNMTIGSILSPNDDTDVACGNRVQDLHSIHKDISNYFYNFIDYDLHKEKMMLNLLGLISYLKLNNAKYVLIDTGDFHTYLSRKKQQLNYNFLWFSQNYEYPMWEWADKEKLLIKDETNGLVKDEHMGIEAHKKVSEMIYNMIKSEKN